MPRAGRATAGCTARVWANSLIGVDGPDTAPARPRHGGSSWAHVSVGVANQSKVGDL